MSKRGADAAQNPLGSRARLAVLGLGKGDAGPIRAARSDKISAGRLKNGVSIGIIGACGLAAP